MLGKLFKYLENRYLLMKIVCRTPVRINLANGGDTDYYIKETGWGCVVNATLSSHFYEFEINDRMESKIDIIDYFDYIMNPNRTYSISAEVSELALLKTTMKALGIDIKNSFVLRTNVPMQSGLGGSSALNVAMVAAMLYYKGESIEPCKVASLAYDIERNQMAIPGGYQDQFAAAYGRGFNYMEFYPQETKVTLLDIPERTVQKLERNLFLYYLTKRKISGAEIHNEQKRLMEKNPSETKKILLEKRDNALMIKEALLKGNLDEFGMLLRKENELKCKLSGNKVDSFIEKALEYGALGGKISGAGSLGGCAFFYVPDENIDMFRKRMASTGATELCFRFQRKHEHGIRLRVIG